MTRVPPGMSSKRKQNSSENTAFKPAKEHYTGTAGPPIEERYDRNALAAKQIIIDNDPKAAEILGFLPPENPQSPTTLISTQPGIERACITNLENYEKPNHDCTHMDQPMASSRPRFPSSPYVLRHRPALYYLRRQRGQRRASEVLQAFNWLVVISLGPCRVTATVSLSGK